MLLTKKQKNNIWNCKDIAKRKKLQKEYLDKNANPTETPTPSKKTVPVPSTPKVDKEESDTVQPSWNVVNRRKKAEEVVQRNTSTTTHTTEYDLDDDDCSVIEQPRIQDEII